MLQYFIPYFPKTSAKTTTFVVKFSKKSFRLLEVENVFGGRAKTFPYPYFGLISDPKKAMDK